MSNPRTTLCLPFQVLHGYPPQSSLSCDHVSHVKELGRSLVLSRQCILLQCTAPCRMSPACHIRHPCLLRHPCRTLRIRHPCRTLPCLLCHQGLLSRWVIMVRAISSLLCLTPIGCLRESRCYNISSFRNSSSLKLGELAKPSLSLSPR